MADTTKEIEDLPILPGDVPVTMPDLPARLTISTVEQFKAVNDKVRMRILNIIRHQPATAKQLADRLAATPGAVGHHLHVLEAAGLVQVVALRVTRGIIARYYTRAARIFMYDLPLEFPEAESVCLKFLSDARDELADATLDFKEEASLYSGFPHARMSRERAEEYAERLRVIAEDLFMEPDNPDGDVYGLSVALFRSPAWLSAKVDKEEKEKP